MEDLKTRPGARGERAVNKLTAKLLTEFLLTELDLPLLLELPPGPMEFSHQTRSAGCRAKEKSCHPQEHSNANNNDTSLPDSASSVNNKHAASSLKSQV